ncbi:hypothetical protein BHE74_00047060 [Ensete ventricosum]|nr:hypothetical protein BHE74_00047060 [Ensete ventricosum]
MPRSEAAMSLGWALARKFCSSSLASWSKEIMVTGWRRSYHIRAGPPKVVRKTPHISALDKSYNAICAQKVMTCSAGSELPSYYPKIGTGMSRIYRAKGDLCLEHFATSSFDLMTSFWTSSRHSFTRRSCTRNELVESDDRVSWSCGITPTRVPVCPATWDLVMWQLRSFLWAASWSNVAKSCKRPEPSDLGSAESLRCSSQGSALLDQKQGSPSGDRVSEHLYLRRQVGRTRVTSLLQDLTGHQPPVVEGIIHWSAAAPALTRRLLPTARGYCLSVGHYACPNTPPVASCHGVLFANRLLRLP